MDPELEQKLEKESFVAVHKKLKPVIKTLNLYSALVTKKKTYVEG